MKIMKIVLILLLISLIVFKLKYSVDGFEDSGILVNIFKSEGCRHCVKAKPEFDKLVGMSPIKLNNGKTAIVNVYDANKDADKMKMYDIKGYPTILLINGSDTVEYPGQRTATDIINYLNSM